MIDDTSKEFIKRHIGPSKTDQKKILDYINAISLEQLMKDTVPNDILLKEDLKIDNSLSESEALKKLKIIRPLKQYLDDNKSYLGICVGMQILSDEGHEDKITKGLGIISGKIKKFSNKKLIIPHMGWNTIRVNKADPIVKKNLNEKDFYFVHSYIYENINKENILGLTTYGKNFPSIINKGNIYGVQFHPEKSHKNGLKLIKNFIMKS